MAHRNQKDALTQFITDLEQFVKNHPIGNKLGLEWETNHAYKDVDQDCNPKMEIFGQSATSQGNVEVKLSWDSED